MNPILAFVCDFHWGLKKWADILQLARLLDFLVFRDYKVATESLTTPFKTAVAKTRGRFFNGFLLLAFFWPQISAL